MSEAPLCGHDNIWYDCPECGTTPKTSRFTLENQQTPHDGPKPREATEIYPTTYIYPVKRNLRTAAHVKAKTR